MNERLKQLRSMLNLSQEEFGRKINLSKPTISALENAVRGLTDRVINDICIQFNVNEHWLRTGEGNMQSQTDSSLLEDLATEYRMTEKQKKIMAAFVGMDDKKREVVAEAFFAFVDALTASPEVAVTIATRPTANDEKLTLEQKRHIVMTELPIEAKGKTSSASTISNGLEKLA